jgi:hypothetical protein
MKHQKYYKCLLIVMIVLLPLMLCIFSSDCVLLAVLQGSCLSFIFVFFFQRHSVRQTDNKSDRSTDVSSAGSASPIQFVGTTNDVYGYVHRSKPSVNLQRSLESYASPRTCDILLDLERSSRSQNSDVGSTGTAGPRTPDLMSKSYHGHFQGDIGAQINVGLMDYDWRTNVESPYADLSNVMAAQVSLYCS